MGWDRGRPADGGSPDQGASHEPAPIEVELVEEDVLPEAAPNTAASELETIRGGSAAPSRLLRMPRGLRALGALAVIAALTVALWPAPGGHRAGPQPGPSPTASSRTTVNVDLYKVRVSGTSLSQDYRDHAVMGLALTNESPSQLTVVNAELWDALGTRLGYSATWPAGYVQPRGSETLAMYLPYSCTVLITTPVLPVTIRYSVSTPEDLSVSHNYDYPLDPTILDQFMHARAGLCTGPAGGVFASAVTTLRPESDHHDRHSFDFVLTVDATGQTGWTLRDISANIPEIAISSPDLPTALADGHSAEVRVHWNFPDCLAPPRWGDGVSAVQITARADGAPPDGSLDQQLMVYLRPELMAEMVKMSCWQ